MRSPWPEFYLFLFIYLFQTKHMKAKKGHGWTRLERTEMNCIWVNLKNVGPPFFQIFVRLYQNIIYTAGKSFSVVMWL